MISRQYDASWCSVVPTDPEATAEGCRRVGTSNDVPTAYAKAYAGSGSVEEQEIEKTSY